MNKTPRLARYDLTGPEGERAIEEELSGGAWFRSAVPHPRMKELMRRSDRPASPKKPCRASAGAGPQDPLPTREGSAVPTLLFTSSTF
jgi:hypothetical protein